MWRCLKQRIVDLCGAGQINGFWFKGHWPIQWSIVLCGTGPNNDRFLYIRLLKDVLFCSFSIYILFLSFQVILSSNSLKGFQQFSSFNVHEVNLEVTLKSRADTTTKAYVCVIRKFLEWSRSRHFNMQLPFPLSVVSLYLFAVQQSCTSSSSFFCP